MASSLWHGHMLRENSHDLRTSGFEVGGIRKKKGPKITWKKQVEEESMKVGLGMENATCLS